MSSLKGLLSKTFTDAEPLDPSLKRIVVREPAQVGQLIRVRRKQLGLTQVQLAQVMGYSPRMIGELERGRQTVAFGTVLTICNRLSVDLVLEAR